MSGRTILVVEDDEDLRSVFRVALTLAGYDVREAGDGLEALRSIDHSPPDLVILDLMLPFMGGDVVRQELASHVFTRNIPVVIVTGSGRDVSDMKVSCVLRKPVTPEGLVRTVQTCLANPVTGTV